MIDHDAYTVYMGTCLLHIYLDNCASKINSTNTPKIVLLKKLQFIILNFENLKTLITCMLINIQNPEFVKYVMREHNTSRTCMEYK